MQLLRLLEGLFAGIGISWNHPEPRLVGDQGPKRKTLGHQDEHQLKVRILLKDQLIIGLRTPKLEITYSLEVEKHNFLSTYLLLRLSLLNLSLVAL